MEPERWSKLISQVRDEEMAVRRVSMDVGRPSLPVAITNRLIALLYDRVEVLEQTVAGLTQAKAESKPLPPKAERAGL